MCSVHILDNVRRVYICQSKPGGAGSVKSSGSSLISIVSSGGDCCINTKTYNWIT